jgi:hypothetical protein
MFVGQIVFADTRLVTGIGDLVGVPVLLVSLRLTANRPESLSLGTLYFGGIGAATAL